MTYKLPSRFVARITLAACVLLLVNFSTTAQTTQTPRQKSPDEVVRVYTELVQTDVMVFDKQGRFVDGLTKENFELRIDGKPRPIQAFDKITAGSDEETQLAAARGATGVNPKRPAPLDRGRIVFFYLDDFHMDIAGVVAARKLITTFIEKQMGQNDQVAIASATGQIGFLQQLTNERMVLRKALERVNPGSYAVRDIERPPMTEYQAMLIERGDRSVFDWFVAETLRQNPGLNRETAGQMVRGRATAIQSQAERISTNTLTGLQSLVHSARNLPGRKLVFFLSGGFLIEGRRSTLTSRLRNVTNAAAKSGVVIYSMDTRGLVATLQDASTEASFDPGGQLAAATSTFAELTATQDPLNALAVDTGGKALRNTNDLTQGLAPAIEETSTYYLLAWKPDAETSGKFRQLEVKLVGRPDLTVRVRKGFFDVDPPEDTADSKKSKPEPAPAVKPAAAKLREAITAAYPERALPILMSVDYYDVPEKGPTLSTSINLPGEFLTFGEQPDGKIQAVVDLTGVYYDEKGAVKASFLERITTTAPSLESTKNYATDIIFNYPAKLAPGLYNVRTAARDEKSGRIGSVHTWIEVPDLVKKQLTISSLLLGERGQTLAHVSDTGERSPVALSASHRFKRDSTLRFLFFTYNAAPAPADQKPDVAVQVQVLRDDQPVITTALRKITTDGVGDLTRVPYAAEIPMAELLPGRYMLQVSVIDRVAKQSMTRKTHFDVY
ncbi:MAG TPA: VWA domain-containing protein [Pyrinomonadaceae bacterium]